MKNKKRIALMVSLVLTISAVLPCTLAVFADETSGDGASVVLAEALPSGPEVTETPVSADEPGTTENVPAGTETPEETETSGVNVSGHIDTGAEDLFNRVMACATLEEIEAAFDEASDEAISALTEGQNAQIDARIEELEPAPAPAIDVGESQPPVTSEIDYAMVSYTNVAPLGDPITGQHQ